MTTSLDAAAWVLQPRPNPAARLRLFCLPHAGGAASIFRAWPGDLEPELEVCPIQLPGRETRLRERPSGELSELVPILTWILRPFLDRPFAFFGHSVGALIAFEVARQLRREGRPGPALLLVAARRAPQLSDPRPPLHALPESELIDGLARRYNGIPGAVRENAELMRLFVPTLRADLALSDTYRCISEPPLDCPISVAGGLADGDLTRDDLVAWGDQTRSSFTLRLLPGDHFFPQSGRARFLSGLRDDVRQALLEPSENGAEAPAAAPWRL